MIKYLIRIKGGDSVIWNIKKIEETEESIVIAYSKDSSFDGKIEFDKQKEKFKILSIATDCDEFESQRLFQFLYTIIDQNTLSFQPYSIVIG